MNRTLPNIAKNHLRQLFVVTAAVLIVLMSCSVKSSIKSLMGIPVNTEQGLTQSNHSFFGNASETCVNGDTTEAKISNKSSSNADDLLPVFITASFFFLPGLTPGKEQSHPLYGNLKIPSKLPLFLLYQKLIVNYSI